jgi:Ca2+-binding RTX toxin-like protein
MADDTDQGTDEEVSPIAAPLPPIEAGPPTGPAPLPPLSVYSGDDDINRIAGSAGDDTIYGLGGDDTLAGFAGNDILEGGSGADLLLGGTGDDTLTGGPDEANEVNTFAFRTRDGEIPSPTSPSSRIG